MSDFVRSASLLIVLLDPFLLSVYLLDLVRALPASRLVRVVSRATVIATVVFVAQRGAGRARRRHRRTDDVAGDRDPAIEMILQGLEQ